MATARWHWCRSRHSTLVLPRSAAFLGPRILLTWQRCGCDLWVTFPPSSQQAPCLHAGRASAVVSQSPLLAYRGGMTMASGGRGPSRPAPGVPAWDPSCRRWKVAHREVCRGRWEDWHCFLVCSREEGDDGISALAGPAVSPSGWRVGSQSESARFLRACRASAPAHGHSRHGDPASCVLCTRNGRRYGYTSHTRAGPDHISPTTPSISIRHSNAVQHQCWGVLQGTDSNKRNTDTSSVRANAPFSACTARTLGWDSRQRSSSSLTRGRVRLLLAAARPRDFHLRRASSAKTHRQT